MKNATKRSILRWVHLVVTIPVLGEIYSPPAQAEQYAPVARWVFVPIIILSGYWMYGGMIFAIIGVATWLGACRLSGYGAAVLSQVGLLIGRKIWLATRARRPRPQESIVSNSTAHA